MTATTVLVGTTKGAFLLRSEDRGDWSLRGPLCDGWPINHVIGDAESGMLWAAGGGEFPGAGVWRSEDGGETWTLSKLSNGMMDRMLAENAGMRAYLGMEPAPPAPFTGEVEALWSLGLSGGTLYAGGKPGVLFASRDRGATWEKVAGLNDHPSRPDWEPGGAGLVLHSIVADPGDAQKLWVGISAAGVFATEDGGKTWDRRNRRDNAEGAPPHSTPGHDHGADVGLCVHNFVRARDGATRDLLYQQNHHGVFRSHDGGRSWREVSAGLPSTFGFPIAVHPREPETLWVLPLNGDIEGRFPPGASAAVWKSTDGGESWSARQDGLPARDCFFTVLRQAMATDRAEPAGVYFGTNSGSVFASRDEGETWSEIARHLPTVLSVETLEGVTGPFAVGLEPAG
jgi:photosystem II stability/assembly factor-like uncharacterized protein